MTAFLVTESGDGAGGEEECWEELDAQAAAAIQATLAAFQQRKKRQRNVSTPNDLLLFENEGCACEAGGDTAHGAPRPPS